MIEQPKQRDVAPLPKHSRWPNNELTTESISGVCRAKSRVRLAMAGTALHANCGQRSGRLFVNEDDEFTVRARRLSRFRVPPCSRVRTALQLASCPP